jgi:hypothetical protein
MARGSTQLQGAYLARVQTLCQHFSQHLSHNGQAGPGYCLGVFSHTECNLDHTILWGRSTQLFVHNMVCGYVKNTPLPSAIWHPSQHPFRLGLGSEVKRVALQTYLAAAATVPAGLPLP